MQKSQLAKLEANPCTKGSTLMAGDSSCSAHIRRKTDKGSLCKTGEIQTLPFSPRFPEELAQHSGTELSPVLHHREPSYTHHSYFLHSFELNKSFPTFVCSIVHLREQEGCDDRNGDFMKHTEFI